MSSLQTFIVNKLVAISLFVSTSCSAKDPTAPIVLVGSTPGDDEVKNILHIPANTLIDFIKWDLQLNSDKSFALNLQYGESQPNTLGFKNDGKRKSFKGTFSVSQNNHFKEVYQLKAAGQLENILIAKLNNNIFHLLSSQQQLMIGNGGWSYSLNRAEPVSDNKITLAPIKTQDNQLQNIYEGRTPCQEMSGQHAEMNVSSACFKIKWKLVLYRDSITHQPATCTIRNIVDNQQRDITGKWEVIKGTVNNPEAIVYKITVSNLADPILFFVADKNVLLFLGKDEEPLLGNKDFSYTMNRVNK